MKEIKHKDKVMLIDDEDSKILDEHYIYILKGYARTCHKRTNKKGLFHRLVLGFTSWDGKNVVDHINGNRLDNRKENLRVVNRKQNAMHRTVTKNGKYRNVYPQTRDPGTWFVSVQVNGKAVHYPKIFRDKELAAVEAEKLRKILFKEFA